MFGSSNSIIIQKQTSKTKQKLATKHKTKLLLVIPVLWPSVKWTEEKKLWIWRSGVILDEGMVSDLGSGVLWPEPCRRWVRWTEEEKLWIWRSGVILDEGMVSDLLSGVLWSEPCRRWVSELKRRSCESEDLEWFWMKEWSLISGQVFSDLNPVEDEWGELKRRSCESEDLEWFWMKEWSLISYQVFSDLNPVEDEWVNWREEAVNLKIWSDSGWRNGLWSRVRCSLTSSGIIGEHLKLLNWQIEVSKIIK